MTEEFDGLVGLVTGGASGIGAAVAAGLLARGAAVAVLDVDTAGAPSGVLPVVADVTGGEGVRAGVRRVVETFGRLDILVNNAGIGAQGTVADNPDTQWRPAR